MESKHTLDAWAAGLFEGDGYLHVRRSNPSDRPNPRFSVRVGMTNTDHALLVALQDAWGGRIRPHRGTALSRKPLETWDMDGAQSDRFLRDIYPHVRGEKRSRIAAALELRDHQHAADRARDSFGRIALVSQEEIAWRHAKMLQTRA